MRLQSITTDSTVYNFTYDMFGNTTEVNAGNNTLASYTYNPYNGKLNTLTYGNGTSVKYLYDAIDRVSEICYNICENGAYETVYSYQYDSAGRLYSMKDHRENLVTVYEYDSQGRPAMTTTYDEETYTNLYDSTMSYTEDSKLQQLRYTIDYRTPTGYAAEEYWYMLNYDAQTGNLEKMRIQSQNVKGWVYTNYNSFGRLTSKTVDMMVGSASALELKTNYSYIDNTDHTTTPLVSSITSEITRGDNTSPSYNTTYSYTYDDNGNITQINSTLGTTRYQYDDLGQLIREDNQELGVTYVYTYDDAGNMTNKIKYDYTSGDLSGKTPIMTYDRVYSGDKMDYMYHEGYWGTLIFIDYDEIGNPVRMWEDCFDMYGYALEWEGRQLVSVGWVDDYTDVTTLLEFTYNADGIRTSKTYNGVKHEYFLNGSQVIAETWTKNNVEHLLIYLYDESGSPLGLKYRNSYYAAGDFDSFFFEKNLQGDIVAVYDDTGALMGRYIYDAWGRCTVVCGCGGLGDVVVNTYNPFRYRGYFYDVETQMYYLQSRYYSPELGRFFNGDSALYSDILGFNLFAYCYNNPVNYVDPTGESSISATWGSMAWPLTLLDGPLPIGDILYWGGLGVLALGEIYLTIDIAKNIAKNQNTPASPPTNLPSESEISVDIDHIIDQHSPNNGKRPDKDKFAKWMTKKEIEKQVRKAYKNAIENYPNSIRKIQPQNNPTRFKLRGTADNQVIEIWVDVVKKMITTAYPK